MFFSSARNPVIGFEPFVQVARTTARIYAFPMAVRQRRCARSTLTVPEEPALKAQLDAERPQLESIAREKYSQGRVSADGEILITANDASSFIE